MTTGRQGYGRVIAADPLEDRLQAVEASLLTVSKYTHFINAKNYDTIQHAIDAAPDYNGTLGTAGAIVFIPAGYYNTTSVPAMGQLTVGDGITLMGEGSIATILQMDGVANKNKDIVTVTGNHSAIIGLTIRGTDTAPDAPTATQGRGIVFGGSGLRHLRMYDVFVEKTGSWCLDCYGTSIESTFDSCRFIDSKTNGGIQIRDACTTMRFFGCEILNVAAAPYLKLTSTTACTFVGCNFENSTANDPGTAFVLVDASVASTFYGCYWEDSHTGATKQYFISHTGKVTGARYYGCFFTRNSGASLRLMQATGTGASTATRHCLISGATCWTGSAPTGTDDIDAVTVNETIYVNHGRVWKTDGTGEAAITVTGAGAAGVTVSNL